MVIRMIYFIIFNIFSSWYGGLPSPYWNDSHKRFRAAVRQFVDTEITPFIHEWDENRKLPEGLHRKFAQAGLLPGIVGGGWPTKYVGSKLPAGLKPEEWDMFHEYILHDELSRCGSGGLGTYNECYNIYNTSLGFDWRYYDWFATSLVVCLSALERQGCDTLFDWWKGNLSWYHWYVLVYIFFITNICRATRW